MGNRMAEIDPNRDPLEALAAEFAERQRRGESPSITEYAHRHPDLAEEIRELFPTLLAVERLKARTERSAGGRVSLGPIKLERLGDFRIIREIGRGGMGIVYEAEQESLGRRVAIKVLPRQSLLDNAHLARFHREAQTAAGLHHTNIVQVFGVGEQDGFHYYVMQLVRGVGGDRVISCLAEMSRTPESSESPAGRDNPPDPEFNQVRGILRQLTGHEHDVRGSSRGPQFWRSVARIGMQAADALGYAHSRGILHRDIKPANLILDDRGLVWIADFGLAKTVQSDDVTQPGDVTGTLRYMAPERFQGRVDVRSDIYSLGLTLYELLVLRPAYEDPDRTSLIRRITQGEPAPPRKLDTSIPHDLETIVLKAIAPDLDDRYPSAEALAADLRCYIEDRPIQSRRAALPERLWRWCRRNPAVATLTGTTVLLVYAVALVATVGYLQTKQALKGEAGQRRKAEAVATVAQDALDRVFDRLSPSRGFRTLELSGPDAGGVRVEVPSSPIISREMAALLEEMLPFYDRLAEQAAGDLELHRRTAEANRRVGDIRQLLGQYEQAAEAYRRSIAIYENPAESLNSDLTARLKTAGVLNDLGRLYRAQRKSAQAGESHHQALAILQALASAPAPSAEVRFELARTYYFLGTPLLAEPGAKPPGPRAEGRPPPPDEPRAGSPPDEPGREPPPPGDPGQESPPRGEPGREPPPEDRGPPSDRPPAEVRPAEQSSIARIDDENLRKASELLNELAKRSPDRPEYRHMLALCDRDRYAAMFPRDRTAATESLGRAIEILEQLVREYPHAPEYRRDLSESYAMADVQDPRLSHNEIVVAEGRLRKAWTIAGELVAQYPQVPEYLSWQAQVCHRLGVALRKLRRLDEAEEYDRKTVTLQTQLVEQLPKVPSHRVWLAAFRNSLADLLLLRDKLAEARPLVQGTITSLDDLLKANPDMGSLHALLAESYRTMGAVLNRSGDQAGSSRARSQAQEHQRLLRERQP